MTIIINLAVAAVGIAVVAWVARAVWRSWH